MSSKNPTSLRLRYKASASALACRSGVVSFFLPIFLPSQTVH